MKHLGTGNQTPSGSEPDSMGVTLLSENEFADSAVVHECHGYAHRKKKLVSSQRSNGGVSPQGYQAPAGEHNRSQCLGLHGTRL